MFEYIWAEQNCTKGGTKNSNFLQNQINFVCPFSTFKALQPEGMGDHESSWKRLENWVKHIYQLLVAVQVNIKEYCN